MLKFFEASNHAACYAKYRPELPQSIAQKIVEFMKERNCTFNFALDVGCGNGQSTNVFSSYFDKVIGIDTSSSQISSAQQKYVKDNLEFKVGDGENLPVSDHTVDLVVSSMAVHWFDFQKFFQECRRVLNKNGCLFLCGHDVPYFYPRNYAKYGQKEELITVSRKAIAGFSSHLSFHDRAAHLDNRYLEIFEKFESSRKERIDNIEIRTETSLADFASYISTWSPYQRYIREQQEKVKAGTVSNHADIMSQFITNIKEGWNIQQLDINEIDLTVVWEYFAILSERPTYQIK